MKAAYSVVVADKSLMPKLSPESVTVWLPSAQLTADDDEITGESKLTMPVAFVPAGSALVALYVCSAVNIAVSGGRFPAPDGT